MQFIAFCLFTIICSYSLVISAPVNQSKIHRFFSSSQEREQFFIIDSAVPDTQETKQQKATAIASRLLKELAGEENFPGHQESSLNNDQNQDAIVPTQPSTVEKVQSHIVQTANTFHDDDDEDQAQEIDFMPTFEDIYDLYSDKYAQGADDENLSNEDINDEDYILPISEQEILRYLAEQEESTCFS